MRACNPCARAGLRDERDLSVGARLACGALAGTTGQTVAYPFDVARRRLQVRTAVSIVDLSIQGAF